MSKKEENKSFAPEFRPDGFSEWTGCEERYATEEEAMGAAKQLATAAGLLGMNFEFRATPVREPVNAKFDLTQTA